MRKFNGCDADSTEREYLVPCSGCGGNGCQHCTDGTVRMRRCPHAVAPGWAKRVCVEAMWASAHGVFPVAGGLYAQSAKWYAALRIVLSERARLESEARENSLDAR